MFVIGIFFKLKEKRRGLNNNILDQIISDIENKNYGSAISDCSELIEQFPDNIKLYEIRSVCYYATGDYDSAIDDLSVIIPKLSESQDDDNYLMSLYNRRGRNYMKKQEWGSAVDDFIKAININDSIPEVHNNLAVCYRRVDNFEDAFIHASKAIEFKNNFPEAFNNRANINVCLQNYEDAISDYSESIKLNPNNPKTYYNRGSIYYEIFNDFENAKGDFLASVKLNPDYEQDICKEYPELKEMLFENAEDVTNDFDNDIQNFEESDGIKDASYKGDEEKSLNEIEDLISRFEDIKKTTEDSIPDTKPANEEIVVPEFDFKSIFSGQEQTDYSQLTEEQNEAEFKPVISDDVKNLHDEILSDSGIKTPEPEDIPEVKEIKKPAPYVPTSRKSVPEKKSFFTSPLFFVSVIVLIIVIVILAVFKLQYTEEKQPVVTNTNQEEPKQEPKEEPKEEAKEEPKEVVKEEVKEEPKEEVKEDTKEATKTTEQKQPVLESKNLGFIGSKQSFVLFSEPDGYYVQIGSFKEKAKAEEKMKLLKKNNIKGAVVEADLKEKGIYYRVRAGAFKSEEEAKQVTLKLE